MKHFILVALLIVFSVGAVAPSAFAFDCPMMNKATATQDMDSDMPCHDPQNKVQHCDGVCLCLHLSISQTQILDDAPLVTVYLAQDVRPDTFDRFVYSSYSYPLLRPPIKAS